MTLIKAACRETLKDKTEIIWEKRRYETARECLKALIVREGIKKGKEKELAEKATGITEILIQKLKGGKK